MTKKISAATTTMSRTTPRTAPHDESTKTAAISSAPPAAPPADAPGATAASAASAPTAEATTPPAAPAAGPEAPTGANETGGEAAAAGTSGAEKKGGAVQIVTRFPPELGARLDRYTESVRSERFGLRVSRADVVRILVHEALKAHEARKAAAPTTTRA